MKGNYKYPLKVWLMGLFLGPIVLFTFFNHALRLNSFSEFIGYYFSFVIFGIPLSAPFFIILRWWYNFLINDIWKVLAIKIFCSLACLVCTYTLFNVLGGASNSLSDFAPLSYSLALILGCFISRVDRT